MGKKGQRARQRKRLAKLGDEQRRAALRQRQEESTQPAEQRPAEEAELIRAYHTLEKRLAAVAADPALKTEAEREARRAALRDEGAARVDDHPQTVELEAARVERGRTHAHAARRLERVHHDLRHAAARRARASGAAREYINGQRDHDQCDGERRGVHCVGSNLGGLAWLRGANLV